MSCEHLNDRHKIGFFGDHLKCCKCGAHFYKRFKGMDMIEYTDEEWHRYIRENFDEHEAVMERQAAFDDDPDDATGPFKMG